MCPCVCITKEIEQNMTENRNSRPISDLKDGQWNPLWEPLCRHCVLAFLLYCGAGHGVHMVHLSSQAHICWYLCALCQSHSVSKHHQTLIFLCSFWKLIQNIRINKAVMMTSSLLCSSSDWGMSLLRLIGTYLKHKSLLQKSGSALCCADSSACIDCISKNPLICFNVLFCVFWYVHLR